MHKYSMKNFKCIIKLYKIYIVSIYMKDLNLEIKNINS
jgi:hypothetical protein